MNIFIFLVSISFINSLSAKTLSPTTFTISDSNNSLYTKVQQISDSSHKVTIECDSKDIKLTHNARVIALSSCGSHDMSHLELLPQLINDSPYAFVVLIEINEAAYDFRAYQQTLADLLQIDATRSLLIDFYNRHDQAEQIQVIGEGREVVRDLIESSSDNYIESIRRAMRSDCTLCLRLMQLTDNLSDFELIASEIDDLKCNSECFRALLDLPFNFNFNGTQVDVYDALHRSHISRMKSSREDAQEINEDFTSADFLSSKVNGTKCDALTTLAWRLRRFNIFDFLIRADCAYPQNFITERANGLDYPGDKKYVRRVENYIEKIEKFHKAIASGSQTGAEAFVSTNGSLVFARTTDNKSALKAAFDSGNSKMFAYLRSVGMHFGDFSEIADYYATKNRYGNARKKLVRQHNRMFTRPVRDDVIEKLIDRSLVHYDARVYGNERIIRELRRIFADLNEFISEALVIAAASSQLEIIFDFDNSDLDEFDPTMSRAYGAAYSFYDYIIISGLDLIGNNQELRNFALGTLAHELFHHVTHQVYGNSFSPYNRYDTKRKRQFHKIFKATRLLKNDDPLIKTVFRNDSIEEHNHGELIARIPDILLTNRDNLTYINECRIKFGDLFSYYEHEVMRDLREIIPTIGARERVREFNEWFNVVAEIQDEEEVEDGKESSLDDDDGDFLSSIKSRTSIAFSYFPKRKLRKLLKETIQRKLLTIFVKSSFGRHKNFKKVMFKIDALNPSVLLIIECDDLKGLGKFDGILDRTGFEKVVAVIDYMDLRKFKRLELFEDWAVL